MKSFYFLFIIVLVSSLHTAALAPDASYLEKKLGETVDIVDETGESGVEIDDLVIRIYDVIDDLNICGWDNCPSIVINEAINELDAVQTEAIERRRSISNELSISIFLIILIVTVFMVQRKYDLLHRIRWYLYKDRQITYA